MSPSINMFYLMINDLCLLLYLCAGTIGFDEEVLKQGNGVANIAAAKQAKDAGAKRMVYVSVSDIVPQALGSIGPFPAYFQGIPNPNSKP